MSIGINPFTCYNPNKKGGIMAKQSVKGFYYITHIDNIHSILLYGILSHRQVEKRSFPITRIYDPEIVANREDRNTPDGKSLWEYANVYFQPRNPMLYKVISETDKKNIAIIGISPQILDIDNSFISLGNAASTLSPILDIEKGLEQITGEYWPIINNDWWKTEDGTKRKIMAECLIPDFIPPAQIHSIYVTNQTTAEKIRPVLDNFSLQVAVVVEPHMFFQPRKQGYITHKMFWVDGDMFFSQMQTLTISVNTVGVMGKGLASRAKYQFPDMYVVYQDVCKSKLLKMGKPHLYKREASLDEDLADEPLSLPNLNANKWFLLFPTKDHWKQDSDADGIEKGLQWVVDNYKTEGIQSLAMPALGCGLGKLDWKDIGPMMSQYLSKLDIQVAIYLPQEQKISPEYLTRKFLLGE
jgi:O-acetyl-ADP-ribose deacetylase (regulator of RNase III)